MTLCPYRFLHGLVLAVVFYLVGRHVYEWVTGWCIPKPVIAEQYKHLRPPGTAKKKSDPLSKEWEKEIDAYLREGR